MLGIFLAVTAIITIRNYFQPYLFLIFIGIISAIISFISTRKIKPYLKLNNKQSNDYYLTYLYICIGFFGLLLFICNKLNVTFLSDKICDNYSIVDKEHIERQGRYSTDESILYLDFGGRTEKVLLNYKYWNQVQIDDEINVCKGKSHIGFDFLTLTDEKY